MSIRIDIGVIYDTQFRFALAKYMIYPWEIIEF